MTLSGCAGQATAGWIRVETEDLVIRTDVSRADAVELAKRYQRLRSAIAENELPCAFRRSNAPMEFVLLKEPKDVEALFGRFAAGVTVPPPSDLFDAKVQQVMSRRAADKYTQLFVHELTHTAVGICFPTAGVWFHEGMAGFYETAQVRDGELVLGIPAYGFVTMDNVEPTGDVYPVFVRGTEVWMLPTRLLPRFEDLRTLDPEGFYALGRGRGVDDFRRQTANYAGAWNAIHLLQLGERRLMPNFQEYLGALAQGEDDQRAWRRAFQGVDFEARYRRYVDSEYRIASRSISDTPPREPVVQSMSEAAAALLWARIYGWDDDDHAAKAFRYLELAAEKEPESTDVMIHFAVYYEGVGNTEEAERWLDKALARAPDDPEVLATAIRWYVGTEPNEARLADLRRWGEALGDTAQTAFQLTELAEYHLSTAGDPEAALDHVDAALSLDATSWRAYAVAGEAYESLGRRADAVRAYRTAIGVSGSNHQSSALTKSLRRRLETLREK